MFFERLSLRAKNGRDYTLEIALPRVRAPVHRIFWVLDGYWYFASAAEAMRCHRDTDDVAVVGVSYPESDEWIAQALSGRHPLPDYVAGLPRYFAACSLERRHDLTLPMAVSAAPGLIEGLSDARSDFVGGASDFLAMLEDEGASAVARSIGAKLGEQAIFGHSLGGLCVLHALFTRPQSYHTFIAASPAIYWNERAVLGDEASFSRLVTDRKVAPKVLITVGDKEEIPSPSLGKYGVNVEQLSAQVLAARLVSNAKELAHRLSDLNGAPGYAAEYELFRNFRHALSPWPALARGIAFAFHES